MIKTLLMIFIQKLVCSPLREETVNEELTTPAAIINYKSTGWVFIYDCWFRNNSQKHSWEASNSFYSSNAQSTTFSFESSSFSIFLTVSSFISSSNFIATTLAPSLTSSYSSLISSAATSFTSDKFPNQTTGNYNFPFTTIGPGTNSTTLPPETGTGMFDQIQALEFEPENSRRKLSNTEKNAITAALLEFLSPHLALLRSLSHFHEKYESFNWL
jgi:hypothetical protein